ncbi:MAG: SpoIIE family protein phosphatase [bacterium]|nr:SpoIIE family protein phosphatase [bacterium]
MSNFDHFRLKNEMLFMNYLANTIGVCVVLFITFRSISQQLTEALYLIGRVAWFFDPLFGCLMFITTLLYERPIRGFLNDQSNGVHISDELRVIAGKRLLNEPFFLIAMNLTVWITAGGIYSLVLLASDVGRPTVYYIFLRNLEIGLITAVAAFFLLRSVLHKRMVPKLFPAGGLYATRGTLRIRLGMRLAALLLGCNLVPFFAIITIMQSISPAGAISEELYESLRSDIVVSSYVFMAIGILLTYQLSINLGLPFRDIIRVLNAIRNGQFTQKVPVTSNDEIGYTGDVINEMASGLKERDRLRRSLELAQEVQQNFMPQKPPQISGLDIAGQSIYCDRTGGDYFDYLQLADSGERKISIVIGDVSGHGIPSALLMAAARSSLRQRVIQPGSIGQIVSDVNRQLTVDVEDSGRFMTLFCSEINSVGRSIRWVRAGHDPALLFDPQTDIFEELKGSGLALGVDQDWDYTENAKEDLKKGQILILCTDGVWEAHNPAGKMFGKDALHQVFRQNSDLAAVDIIAAVLAAVKKFQDGVEQEDDITLVVVKIIA